MDVIPNTSDYLRGSAGIHRSLGNLLLTTKRLDDAEQAYRKSVTQLEKLVGEFPKVPAYREELSNSRNNLAAVLRATNRIPEAIKIQRQAVGVQKILADDFPDIPQYQRTLIACYMNLGIYLKASGERAQAEEAYRSAAEVATKLVGRFETVPEYQHQLALSHLNLGNLLRETNRFAEAEKVYDKAESTQRGLVEKYPKVPEYRGHLSKMYVVVGHLRMNTGRQRDALKAYRDSLEMDPKNLEAKNALCWVLATGADRELRDSREAVALAKELVAQAKDNPEYWTSLGIAQYRAGDWKASLSALEASEQLSKPGDGPLWFFMAMNHARLGNAGEARKCYDRAVSWMDANQPKEESLTRFRDEAASLLNISAQPKPTGGDPDSSI